MLAGSQIGDGGITDGSRLGLPHWVTSRADKSKQVEPISIEIFSEFTLRLIPHVVFVELLTPDALPDATPSSFARALVRH